jgi:hypothetical protein
MSEPHTPRHKAPSSPFFAPNKLFAKGQLQKCGRMNYVLTLYKIMDTSNYLECYLSEIMELRAFEAGAPDYLLMNYFAIGSVLVPKRRQNGQGLANRYTI